MSDAPPRRAGSGRLLRVLRDLGLALAVALLLSHVVGAWRAPDLPDDAPDFLLRDIDGVPLRLSDYRGQRVVLNFWATWCGPCRLEAPAFSRWAERNPDAVILGIAADGTDQELRRAAQELGITYRVARGSREVFQTYGVDTYPTTVVIGPDGRVQAAHTGLLFDPQLAWLARER